ncbi:MAG: FliH/SctL family protein, partial [Edwardsiella sp. (in: enterobacteria)]
QQPTRIAQQHQDQGQHQHGQQPAAGHLPGGNACVGGGPALHQLEQQGWKLLADTQLHRGGCKISAEGGELDASIATRWQELCKLAAPELPL